MAMRFVIAGSGPAGTTAATHATRLEADLTPIARDALSSAPHLWDCIPSQSLLVHHALADAAE